MKRRALRLLAGALLLAVLSIFASAAWVWSAMHRPYAGWEGDSASLILEPGLDAGSMLRRLGAAGVLERPRVVRGWLSWRGGAERLQAGEYRFERAASPLEILARLERGDVLLHPVTFPEGLNFREVAVRLEQAGFGDRATFEKVFRDPTPIAALDPQATDLEGYLFPDTYNFPRQTAPAAIVATLVGRFRQAMGKEFFEEVEAGSLSLRETVVLASMIEKETGVAPERERISQVFHNRLARGMRLECDPTVIYALERAGKEVGRLTYADLKFESPWNTYVIPALPVGPIANPGRDSLLAAVRPSEGDDLFFVAAPDGGHRFSKDLAGHLRAVKEWRRHLRSSR